MLFLFLLINFAKILNLCYKNNLTAQFEKKIQRDQLNKLFFLLAFFGTDRVQFGRCATRGCWAQAVEG
jgi:hypothetical protein